MIVYNNISLESAARIRVKDVHVSPIKYDELTRPRAINGGSVFVRSRAGIRTVTVTFALLDEDQVNRQAALLAVSQWAKTDQEYRLDLPGHPEHYLMAICTEKPAPSLREWWESDLRLVFTCFDNPFWNSKSVKSVSCGTAFHALGDAPPLVRIERTVTGSAVSNQSYSLDGRTMSFSTIPVGNMVIELNKQLAYSTNNGVIIDLMQYYNINSLMLIPRTGSQTITGTGTVKYRERFE